MRADPSECAPWSVETVPWVPFWAGKEQVLLKPHCVPDSAVFTFQMLPRSSSAQAISQCGLETPSVFGFVALQQWRVCQGLGEGEAAERTVWKCIKSSVRKHKLTFCLWLLAWGGDRAEQGYQAVRYGAC